jgi:hypothetical protein
MNKRFLAFPLRKKSFFIAILVPLILSGVFLLNVEALVFGQSASIFSDSFESGSFSVWTGTKTVASGVTATVQTSTVLDGVYAMKVAVADGARESGVCKYKDFGSTYSAVDAKVMMQFSAKPRAGCVLEVFGFSSDGWLGNRVGTRVDVVNVNGVLQWRLNYYSGGWKTANAGTVNLNSWYCVEVKLVLGGGTGETTLYVNGSALVSKTGLTNNVLAKSVRYFSLGIDDVSGRNTLSAFFDSAAVSTGYIGPDPTPTPSPTPTSTPNPTSSPTPAPSPTPNPTATPDPTVTPSPSPAPSPSAMPTQTPNPTTTPSPTPTITPTLSPTPTPTPSPSTTVFSDSFSGGNFNQWTTSHLTSGATQNIANGVAHFCIPAGGNGVVSNVQKIGFTSTVNSVINVTEDFYLASVPSGYGLGSNAIVLSSVKDSADENNGNFAVMIDGSDVWALWIGGYPIYSYVTQTAGAKPASATWYHTVLNIDNPAGKVTLTVNGTKVISVSEQQFIDGTHSFDLYTGIVEDWTPDGKSHEVDVDNVRLDMSDPQNIQPNPTPTVTPTPSPTTPPAPTPTPTGIPTYKEKTLTKPIQANWIATDGTLYAGINQTLYKSTDQGVTWQSLLTFSPSTASISAVYVSKLNYIFVAPDTNAAAASLGIWRSTNGGQTWTRVLPLPLSQTTMAIAEDSNGNLFTGIYTSGSNTANATICKSTDGGATWSTVYYDSTARHVHCVAVDLANNYVYASVGDVRVWNALTGQNCDIDYVIRSQVNGNLGTWVKILQGTANAGDPQMLAIGIVDGKAGDGSLTPAARLFATDYNNGGIYLTTDDVTFNKVLDTGGQSYGFWIRRNDLNGYLYASFVGGDSTSIAGIWISTNGGSSWSIYKTYSIHTAYFGSLCASNFWQGTMYYSVQLDNGMQNGTEIYPDYSASFSQNSMLPLIGYFQFDLSLIQTVLLNPSIIMVLVAFAVLMLPNPALKTFVKFGKEKNG